MAIYFRNSSDSESALGSSEPEELDFTICILYF